MRFIRKPDKPSNDRFINAVRDAMDFTPYVRQLEKVTGHAIFTYTLFWSLSLLAAAAVAAVYTGEGVEIFANYFRLLTSPSKLITDYFSIGSLASSLLNAGICGLFCDICFRISKAAPGATMLAGYFLVIAHCFYGLNILNMIPPFAGILVFCLVKKSRIGDMLHLAMFATSLGPFISDFLFRYTLGDNFSYGKPQISITGIFISIIFSLAAGFIIPALLPGTTKMHRGHSLYKAGLAIGLFGVLAHALFYKVMGIESPEALIGDNAHYNLTSQSYQIFMSAYFGIMFIITLVVGIADNGWSMKGYRRLFDCDGWQDNFPVRFGMPLTLINIGIYGLAVLLYFNLVIIFTEGVGYTGPTSGVTIAAITFAAAGQTPKNVWPIALGYLCVFGLSAAVCALAGLPLLWSVSTQAYINGVGFATGLCPFAGRYGWKVGTVAGALSAILCTSTSAMHGGFVLYNGGFTAGLAAMILIPILDFYDVKIRSTESD